MNKESVCCAKDTAVEHYGQRTTKFLKPEGTIDVLVPRQEASVDIQIYCLSKISP